MQKLLELLSPLESPKRHQDMRAKRYPDTGAWLLQHKRFRFWKDCARARPSLVGTARQGNLAMCCYGMPGAGKTIIWFVNKYTGNQSEAHLAKLFL